MGTANLNNNFKDLFTLETPFSVYFCQSKYFYFIGHTYFKVYSGQIRYLLFHWSHLFQNLFWSNQIFIISLVTPISKFILVEVKILLFHRSHLFQIYFGLKFCELFVHRNHLFDKNFRASHCKSYVLHSSNLITYAYIDPKRNAPLNINAYGQITTRSNRSFNNVPHKNMRITGFHQKLKLKL